MAAYASLKGHKHARRHDKLRVFSALLQDSPSLNDEALFFYKTYVGDALQFTLGVGPKLPGYASPPVRQLPCPGRMMMPSQCHSRLQTQLPHLLNRLGLLQGQRYAYE